MHGCQRVRITPADAGSTPAAYWLASASKDHPRGRGEHKVTVREVSLVPGSPPRTRGAHFLISILASLVSVSESLA